LLFKCLLNFDWHFVHKHVKSFFCNVSWNWRDSFNGCRDFLFLFSFNVFLISKLTDVVFHIECNVIGAKLVVWVGI
jgi:hypothetical protein